MESTKQIANAPKTGLELFVRPAMQDTHWAADVEFLQHEGSMSFFMRFIVPKYIWLHILLYIIFFYVPKHGTIFRSHGTP